MMTMGQYLKKRREHLGFSLREVAEACDISKAHYWDLEQGRSSNPSIKLCIKLCYFLQINIEDLTCCILEG